MRISTFALGAALLAGQLALAQGTPPVQEPGQNGTSGSGSNAASENQQVSRLAARMLEQTNEARKAIRNKDRVQAEQNINNALNLAQQIQQMQPNRKIIPIYAELQSKSVLEPALEARTQPQGFQGQPPRTDEAQQGGQPQGMVVQKTTGQLTFIGVDMANTVQHLQAAKAALNNNNPVAADDALLAVENNVITAQVASDMPLLRARQNLALAETYAKQGRAQDTSAALEAAAEGLASYSNAGGPHASQARALEQQVRSYSQSVRQQQPQQAAAQIETWWNETSSWFRQA
jgi:hypothetical protein